MNRIRSTLRSFVLALGVGGLTAATPASAMPISSPAYPRQVVTVAADCYAIGQEVAVEYYEGSHDAVHVYAVGGGKALDAEQSGGAGSAATIAIILALIAIAIAVVIVIVRNRRKPEVK